MSLPNISGMPNFLPKIGTRKFFAGILLFIFFLIFYAFWLWPLPMEMSRRILYLTNPGDAFNSIWSTWWWKHAHEFGQSFSDCRVVGYPLGVQLGLSPAQPLLEPFLRGSAFFLSEISAYNLWILLSGALSALSMTWLAWLLTRDLPSSVIAGLGFLCAPYRAAHLPQIGLAATHWIPLTLATYWNVTQSVRPARWGIGLGIALACTALSNYYYGYVAGIVLLLALVSDGLLRMRAEPAAYKRTVRAAATGIVLAVVIVGAFVAAAPQGLSQISKGLAGYAQKDLFVFSAKPWDYLLPPANHPWLGRWTGPFIQSHLYGSNLTEQTLYLGWTLLFCAIILLWLRARNKLPAEQQTAVAWLSLIALGGILWSFPPFIPIGPFEVINNEIICRWKWPFPSYLMHRILPMFRVYSRFGIIPLIALCALLAVGLAQLRKKQGMVRRWALPALVALVMLAEFSLRLTTFDASAVPPVYEWLKNRPETGAIVEYPWRESTHYENYRYQFFQRIHRRPMLNGGWPGSMSDKIRIQCRNIEDPAVVPILEKWGARFIIVHADAYRWDEDILPSSFSALGKSFPIKPKRLQEQLPPPSKNSNRALRLIAEFGETWVYEPAIE